MKRLLAFVVAVVTIVGESTHAATPQAVDDAVRRGVAFLYTKQNEKGHWEHGPAPASPNALGGGEHSGQWGGRTSLVTYALLAAGERGVDPNVRRAVDWLREAKMTGSYALGLRANVWFNLPQTPAVKGAMERDARLLRRNRASGQSAVNRGLFDYQAGGPRVDLSASQYGVLGCWAAAQRVDAFDTGFWAVTEKAWGDQQNEDGGWAYGGRGGGSTIQMTAAGVATLFITQELAHANDRDKSATDAARLAAGQIDRGLEWIGRNLADHLRSPMLYALYGIERVGVASGYKYIGDVDWYAACTDVLLSRQQADGSWGGGFDSEVETGFALLFLSRGRAPVMVNKLEYNLTPRRDLAVKPIAANWNLRPRDMANVTRWVEERIERKLNWQAVKLSVASVDDLHDAPLLYLTGKQPVNLNDDDKNKLKQYVEEGGLIIASGDGTSGNDPFTTTVRTFGEELFPGHTFRSLDAESGHILVTGQQFPIGGQKRPIAIEAIDNGARVLMLLVPKGDLSAVFQRRDTARSAAYEFFANAYLYAIEKTARPVKGLTHVVRPNPATRPSQTMTVARIKYDGQWNPEPGGWRRLAAVMHNEADTTVTVRPVMPGVDKLDGVTVAHLTGTSAFAFTDPQRAALKQYLTTGGLLLIDNCGGGTAFDTAVRAELTRLIPDAESQLLAPLPLSHPLFNTGDGGRMSPEYRAHALPALGPLATSFQMRGLTIGGKLALLYSPQDLSVGLVGHPVDGVVGYTPDTATALVRRVLELRKAGKL